MDGWTYGRTEFLSILQDFVPCWGRCPATFYDFTTSKRQGKGTADLMMPFCVLLEVFWVVYLVWVLVGSPRVEDGVG